jgi:hypothetical protein
MYTAKISVGHGKRRHNYPATRKPANRSKESYLPKTPEGKQRQLANLRRDRPKKPNIKDLASLDIMQFCRYVLEVEPYFNQAVLLKALYGLPLDAGELESYRYMTGSDKRYVPGHERTELVAVLGARSGKSWVSAVCGTFEATCRAHKWRQYLQADEIAYIVISATRLQQSVQIIGRACSRMLENSKIADLVEDSFSTELILKNGITIMSLPCSSTAGRGIPIAGLLLDEIGWYRLEGPKCDDEVMNALRPRMSQFRGAKLFAISTPASKQGVLWRMFDEGPDVPGRLTVKAETEFMNPNVSREFLESEKRRSPDNYQREFMAEFSETVSAFFPFDKVNEACVLSGDILPNVNHRYYAAADPSGLTGRDRFALSIAHKEGNIVIVDLVRSWSTKSGSQIVGEILSILKDYNITLIQLDRYGAGWIRQQFEAGGIETEIREALPKIYSNLKSLMMANAIRLPDTKPLKTALLRTNAFYGRNGALSIHRERTEAGHGDEADSTANVAYMTSSGVSGGYFSREVEYQRTLGAA